MKTGTLSVDRKIFSKVIDIHAPAAEVWHALTTPGLMNQWMMPDAKLEIVTVWKVGAPIFVRGHMNGKDFENKGTVLQVEPERELQYTHLSSISRLPDRPENYAVIDFRLVPVGEQTTLELRLSNFPNESILKHLTFYWNVTLEILKRMVEGQESTPVHP
jgi:uncharacterized protein YndB with AHSA1/START domain